MVMVRTIVRALVVALVAVHAQEQQQPADAVGVATGVQTEQTTCVAPTVVTDYETTIEALEKKNAEWATRLETASAEWTTMKDALEAQVAKEQKQYHVVSEQLEKTQSEAKGKIGDLEQKIATSEQEHKATLKELQTQVASLEKTVKDLKSQLAAEKEALVQRDSEVTATKAKLLKYTDQVKALEHDVATARKNNEALRIELGKIDEKLTMSALLSAYYDEGVIIAGNLFETVKERIEQAQQSTTHLSEALDALESTKTKICETTDKLYADHLAATLDPLIADVRRATDPYIKKYRPVVDAQIKKSKKAVVKTYNNTLKRAIAARIEAITLLQQNEQVAPFAQTIVDGSLVLVAIPIALFLVRLALRLTWWVIATTFCLLTCGLCCGKCGRKRPSKLKRKLSRKPLTTMTPPTSKKTTTSSSSMAGASSTHSGSSNRRSSGKKGK